jgi:transposase
VPPCTSSYTEPKEGSIFQLGHSKDHRPDLAQVKIMLSTLYPLGLPLAAQVVEGNEADDPLYEPAIKQVCDTLNKEGVLYVGDCKMAASATRAGIEHASDYYLMPLPATIVPNEVLDTYLKPVLDQIEVLEPICRYNNNGELEEIAEGFELTETVTGQTDGETISWSERRLVIRSIKYADAQEKALNKRLKKAKTAIADLTRPRSGYKCITTLDLFWPAVNDILKHHNIEGLLEIDAQESVIELHRRGYRGKPARIEIQQVLDVKVQDNETANKAAIDCFGF